MLVSFSVENWMSFRDKTTLSMIASRERQHGNRVPRIEKYSTRILPVAAIYGGNASGKTNFFKALNFAKNMITQGTQPDNLIPAEPFLMNEKSAKAPSRFIFELLIDDIVYEFSFAADTQVIREEKLVQINHTSEKVLYHRHNGKPDFDPALNEDQFLHFAFQGTRDNQLFLTNSVSQKVKNFEMIYYWFKNNLEMVAPDARFEPFEKYLDVNGQLFETMNRILPHLDTGITRLDVEEIPIENLQWPELFKNRLVEDLKEGAWGKLVKNSVFATHPRSCGNERLVITRKGGKLIAKRLVTWHRNPDGSETRFDVHQESDGSQRVIDLLPAFLELSAPASKKVFVIDELDRSLHTLLTRQLLEMYLDHCAAESRAQLLLTTHDALLMDQKLFRRDEMWLAERDNSGNSELIAVSSYKDVRYDKDLRKSYLQGRLGGIPFLTPQPIHCHED